MPVPIEKPLEKRMSTHSNLKNPMDRGAWQATVHRAAKTEIPLSD